MSGMSGMSGILDFWMSQDIGVMSGLCLVSVWHFIIGVVDVWHVFDIALGLPLMVRNDLTSI